MTSSHTNDASVTRLLTGTLPVDVKGGRVVGGSQGAAQVFCAGIAAGAALHQVETAWANLLLQTAKYRGDVLHQTETRLFQVLNMEEAWESNNTKGVNPWTERINHILAPSLLGGDELDKYIHDSTPQFLSILQRSSQLADLTKLTRVHVSKGKEREE